MADPNRSFEIMRLKREEYEERTWTVERAEQESFTIVKEESKRLKEVEQKLHIRKLPSRKLQQRQVTELPVKKRIPKKKEPGLPLSYNVHWTTLKTPGWVPETREGATLNVMEDRLVLYGGGSHTVYSDACTMHVQHPAWTRVDLNDPEGRLGHTAVACEDGILVFGGLTQFSSETKMRECLNTQKILTPSLRWKYLKATGNFVVTRRYHSASMVGNQMLVFGGLSERNKVLGDLAVLDIRKLKWKNLQVLEGPTPLAFHSAVTVVPKEYLSSPDFDIFNMPEVKLKDNGGMNVKQPGVYIFGGKDEAGVVHATLWILKLGTKPLQWVKPECGGRPPQPRLQQTMTYLQSLNVLVVYGGRNEHEINYFLDDICMLNLDTLTWASVCAFGNIPAARFSHSATSYGSKMLIFGGIRSKGYTEAVMHVVELDQTKANKLIADDNERRRRMKEREELLARKAKLNRKDATMDSHSSVAVDLSKPTRVSFTSVTFNTPTPGIDSLGP
jgi:N-acetylneuraminic acid mutarotase